VIKPGGIACMIGPVHPTHPVSRFFADAWMLFPKESEYIEWYTKAGETGRAVCGLAQQVCGLGRHRAAPLAHVLLLLLLLLLQLGPHVRCRSTCGVFQAASPRPSNSPLAPLPSDTHAAPQKASLM
jgi:hypothetical protein